MLFGEGFEDSGDELAEGCAGEFLCAFGIFHGLHVDGLGLLVDGPEGGCFSGGFLALFGSLRGEHIVLILRGAVVVHVEAEDGGHGGGEVGEDAVGWDVRFFGPPLEDGFAHGEACPLAEVDLVAVEVW